METRSKGRRPVEEIIKTSIPEKSAKQYQKTWDEFATYNALEKDERPTEEQVLQYLDMLRVEKKMKSSSIWTRSSELNCVLQRNFGIKLQDTWPRVQMLLKSYEKGYTRKTAKPFNLEEVRKFLSMDFKKEPFWLVRQAIMAVGFSGGLRCVEVKSLKIEDVKKTEEGYAIDFIGAKQRGEVKTSSFLVPFDPNNNEGGFGERLQDYLEELKKKGIEKGSLIRGCNGGRGFIKSPMGRTLLLNVCKDVAEKLGLPNPNEYTGHSLRRSSARSAGDSGANSVELKRFFRWKSDTMPMKYIDGSAKHTITMAKMITGIEVEAKPVRDPNVDEEAMDEEKLASSFAD